MRAGRIAVLALLASGLALARAPEPAPERFAMLEVDVPAGCDVAAAGADRTDWPDETLAVHEATLWLNSRESIHAGPVDLDVTEGHVTAWVDLDVEPIVPGEPVATCLRAVAVRLTVAPLPHGDYTWSFKRGPRKARAEPAAEAAPAPEGDSVSPNSP